MATSDDILRLSPLPAVDLHHIDVPRNGLLLRTPEHCARYFHRARTCREHYARLETQPQETFVQCPFGFSSFRFSSAGTPLALTGLIAYPRQGGEQERRLAKAYPDHHTSASAAKASADALAQTANSLLLLEKEALKKHSMALHELRKLNRSVKQTAERLCLEQSPKDPETADLNLVRIWKTADLMSHQFDVVELLANEGLAALPLNTTVEIYKLFDKCARIYRPPNTPRRLVLTAPGNYSPRIAGCDKTLPIIPTVLIENALRYALKDSEVKVSLRPDGEFCRIEVANLTQPNAGLTQRVFDRGVSVHSDSEGSGNGLYIAQLVAKQHGAEIQLKVEPFARDRAMCTFALAFRTVP